MSTTMLMAVLTLLHPYVYFVYTLCVHVIILKILYWHVLNFCHIFVQLKKHLEVKGGDCPLQEIPCPYYDLGCVFKVN